MHYFIDFMFASAAFSISLSAMVLCLSLFAGSRRLFQEGLGFLFLSIFLGWTVGFLLGLILLHRVLLLDERNDSQPGTRV